MTRVEAAVILIEAEAEHLVKTGVQADPVKALYGVSFEVSREVGRLMEKQRREERLAKGGGV